MIHGQNSSTAPADDYAPAPSTLAMREALANVIAKQRSN